MMKQAYHSFYHLNLFLINLYDRLITNKISNKIQAFVTPEDGMEDEQEDFEGEGDEGEDDQENEINDTMENNGKPKFIYFYILI